MSAHTHGRAVLPENPKDILAEAISVSENWWIDEKGTKDHPGVFQRKPSVLGFDEAYEIINANSPKWSAHYRNESRILKNGVDYWDFGGTNIGKAEYGYVYLWIHVSLPDAERIFSKWNISPEFY